MARQHLGQSNKAKAFFECQGVREEAPQLRSPSLPRRHEPEGESTTLNHLQHPEQRTSPYQQLQPANKTDPSIQQSEKISPVLQYLQRQFQRESNLTSFYPRNASQVDLMTQAKKCEVPMNKTFTVPATKYMKNRSANLLELTGHAKGHLDTFCMPLEQIKEKRPSFQDNSCKDTKSQIDSSITDIPSSVPKQPCHTQNNSTFNVKKRAPSALCINLENRNDPENISSKRNGYHQKGRPGSAHLPTRPALKEMKTWLKGDTNSENRDLSGRKPQLTGSPKKTTKGSCEDISTTPGLSNSKGSLASKGQGGKVEGKLNQKKSNFIPNSIKAKYGTSLVKKLNSEEQARQTLCETQLIKGQKRLIDRFQPDANAMRSSPFADYYKLGLRSSNTEGGTSESRSLMSDSYTPDVIKQATRDPAHWHGRKIDDLGRWFKQNAVNLNLQKALGGKFGERKGSKA